MSLRDIGRKPQRFSQRIWLSHNALKGVLELSEKLNVATNVVCASIIEQFFNQENVLDEFKAKKEIVKVAEFRCPFCLSDTKSINELKSHLLSCIHAKSAFSGASESKTAEVSQNV